MTIVVEETPGLEKPNLESSRAALSWGAVLGGAVAALAATLVLVLLGSALGFASVSPWASAAAPATALGVGAVVWLVVTQWLSAAFGGYLTGRLRTKWAHPNSDEVFFRDTAHGFLSWAVSTAIVALVVMSAAAGGANIAGSVASGLSQGAMQAAGAAASDPMAYINDTLFRPASNAGTTADAPPESEAAAPAETLEAAPVESATTSPAAPPSMATSAASGMSSAENSGSDADLRAQTTRILGRATTADMPAGDRTYLAEMISTRAGITKAEAEQRIDEAVATVKESAETARKAAVGVAFASALSLLVGAFVAAAAGALGGRHRDEI